ncbi:MULTISPECIES: DNRLRE domain-containing protein [unclassified Halobellus]|uniref:DNRLRE domain-containing protein n=1 Tax=unclassified Halobellus TaxID=2638438 RepID=UPI000EF275CF|nr:MULTISPECIES: DNRLRE domain-containing protein [unclassified Halobellus]MDQ2054418.1 DNRLRE domain-containing protein [Halobellus sp. H-GB7]RLM88645.1 serine/threonine protein phosphatase [Halobellus sp. Atlit-38R]
MSHFDPPVDGPDVRPGVVSNASDRFSISRRTLLGALGGGVLAALQPTPAAGQTDDYWTVVAIPDTQKYAEKERLISYAIDQTDWIADNVDSESIRFVTHEGDLVENGSKEDEWDRIDGTMSTLDGVVPYSTLPGNHDWADTNDKSSSVENYAAYFGPERFDDYSWYGGSGPRAEGLNSYQLFSAGDYDFLHLALEWEPSGTVDDDATPLGWAQSVLEDYPDRPTILTTHSYLRDDGSRASNSQDDSDEGNPGEVVWQDLIEPNPQIFLVLNGHWHEEDGEYHQVSENAAGEPVYEVVADYQDRSDGGNGWLRLVQFHPGGGDEAPDRIQFRTYSPSLGGYENGGDSEFAFDLDFDARFDPAASEGTRTSFQQGVDGYDGTVDTNLREADPESSDRTASTVTVDTNDPQNSENRAQALLRFDDIVGDADGQISSQATVQSATLTVETIDEGDGAAVHRMLSEWRADDTWTSMDGGIQADGSEAATTPDAKTGSVASGSTRIDVTDSVKRWADGAANYGWAFLPLGDDGWDFETAEGETPPTLTVRYVDDADGSPADGSDESLAGDADGDGDVDGDDVEQMQRYVNGDDVTIDRDAADVDDDGDVDIGDIVTVADSAGGS